MNPEFNHFKKSENIETRKERRDLTSEQKRILGEVWIDMVVDYSEIPKNFSEMPQDELKAWLYNSLMKDVDKLSQEFGLKADDELSEKIEATENIEEKSILELAYIKNIHNQIDERVRNFDRSGTKSTKWDSWPKKMRETGEFNCVGATLLGMSLLDKGDIKNYYGNPHGHVISVAQLSNGEWWYVDFRNGDKNVLKIEPEEIKINDIRVLKIDNPEIDYRLIPIYENKECVGSVLGNLSSLQNKEKYKETPDLDVERIEEQAYLKKYTQNFQKADFSLFHESLYPEFVDIEETADMKRESERIDTLRNFQAPVQDFMKTLTKDQEVSLVSEMKNKKQSIENLFMNGDLTVLNESSNVLKKVLELFLESLRKIKDSNLEDYEEAVDMLVARVKKI